jgi:hypothetical protein
MGINFPNAPTTGQLYPQPPVAGLPVYRWDGTKWTTTGANSGYVYVGDAPPGAPDNSLWWESDSGVLYVRYNDGDSSQWVAVTPVSNPPAPVLDNDVGRNLIHNPLFNIAQRGVGGSWTTYNLYTADRWQTTGADTSYSFSLVASNDATRSQIGDESVGAVLSNTFTGGSAAANYTGVVQKIEGVKRLANKTVTVSFYAWASAAGMKLGVSVDQFFGTGGSPSATIYNNGQAVTLASTWTRYSLTFPLGSFAGKTLGTNGDDWTSVSFWYSSGSTNAARSGNVGVQSGTVQIWGIQLEVGSTMTSLEKPDPQQDIAKCQRFYQVVDEILFGSYVGVAGTLVYASVAFPVAMRAQPASVFANTAYGNASNLVVNGVTASSMGFTVSGTAIGAMWCQSRVNLSADL